VVDVEPAFAHRAVPAHGRRSRAGTGEELVPLVRVDPDEQVTVAVDGHEDRSVDQDGAAAEHGDLPDGGAGGQGRPDALEERALRTDLGRLGPVGTGRPPRARHDGTVLFSTSTGCSAISS
jgi:hypothetical protein